MSGVPSRSLSIPSKTTSGGIINPPPLIPPAEPKAFKEAKATRPRLCLRVRAGKSGNDVLEGY